MKTICFTLALLSTSAYAATVKIELLPVETKHVVISKRAEKGRYDVYNFKNEIIGYDENRKPVYEKSILDKVTSVLCSQYLEKPEKFDAKSEKECVKKIIDNYDFDGTTFK